MKRNNNSNHLPRVCVFMSTYNGEAYIKTQIDSILASKEVEVLIVIRDDGSTDSTKAILEDYSSKDKRINVIFGENIGFEHSFAEVSRQKDFDCDYYAFSDQDDYWNEDRLIKAVHLIDSQSGPTLYGSNFYITDGNLNIQKPLYTDKKFSKVAKKMAKYGIFYENMYGCTMVWNRELNDILLEHKPISKVSQDVWTQTVAEVVGANIVFDSEKTILHRIHSKNTAGIESGFFKRVKKGLKIYVHSDISTKNEIVSEILEHYKQYNLDNSKKNKIKMLIKAYNKSFFKKIRLMWLAFWKTSGFERKIFKSYLVLINRY